MFLSWTFLTRGVFIFQGSRFCVSRKNLAEPLRFSLASHLSSLAVLRFAANWPSVSSIMRRYWCSRWHWKSPRCLQKTEVLASLRFGGRLFSLAMNPPPSFVCVLVSCPCAEAFSLQLQILLHNIFVFIEDVASDE